jgi:hypothetical protein|tara:strand:+ start:1308 stop:1835 length:528 start_codon:yes stop_codon:yes gene_type:complete
MRSFNKKASLELSIRAIVIVVLAMTLLGLGLGFVRNMFEDIGDTTGQVTEQIRSQILEDLRRGDRKLSFPTTELKLQIQRSKIIAVGVKNTVEDRLDFKIEVNQIDANGQVLTNPDLGTFIYNTGTLSLEINEANVYPIRFTAGDNGDTGIFEIKVIDTFNNVEYASKSFFITVQ